MKKVSAIIVNWNDRDATSDCIRSLLEQDFPELEIIVSDNGSTDGSNEHIRKEFPSVKLVENGRNLGFGTAVNRGFEAASGDYLIFLNNDLILNKDSIGELVHLLESDPGIGAAVPKILYVEKNDTINSFGVLIHYSGMACPNRIDEKDSPDLEITETACGGICMLRREVYEQVGGFDEDLFLYHEDHDFSWRIRLAGWKIMATPKAVFRHHYHFSKGVKKFYSSEKNRLFLLLKNFERRTLLLIFPALLAIEAAQWIHALTNGWFLLKIKSYFEIAGLLPRILKKRRRIRSLRRVPDKEIIRLHEGVLAIGRVKHPLLDNFLSPALNVYWKIIRDWI
ncbi:MAG: glycosyltransferase family 2 protein [Nitrospinaceae bacterium]